MLKGRRARNAEKVSAKPLHDDTASPKRKDIKYASKDNNGSAETVQQINNITAKFHVVEPMKLRGGRVKSSNISQYLEKKTNPKTKDVITSIDLPQTEDETIDITHENADDSFEEQLLDSSVSEIRNEMIETKKSINNNIFLQEPVLSLNFAKVSNAQNHTTFKMMHNSFLTNSELKHDSFSSPLQPKINSFWKVNSMKIPEDQKKTSIALAEQHVLDLSKPTQVTQIDSTTTSENLLHDGDNSCDSGDSGVVILSGSDGSNTSHTNDQTESTMSIVQVEDCEKRKKPATPHRILCPSPAKNAIIYLQSPPGLLNVASPDSNRSKRRAGITKTRKRLIATDDANTNGLAEARGELKPQKQSDSEIEMRTKIGLEVKEKIHEQNRQLIVVPVNPKQAAGGNKKITEFYPIRRSVRKTKKEVQVERDRDIEQAIREGREEGLKIEQFDGKGRGIVTTRPFSKGEFVVEYIGDLISVSEAKQREQIYAKDDNTGCYMYYFRHKNLQHCIDATAESGKLGRLVNHSRNGNLVTKTVPINNRPHLVLIAKEDIEKGVEVTYDYGDRSKEALQHYPWLAL